MKQSEHTTTNTFNTGLNLDVDPLKKPGNSLSDAFDVKIIGHDGQNFTVTNANGNELSFAITTGFKPLGYAVYNGVAYIASYNSATNKGEIGSFPSPPLGGGAFVRTYRALQNWTGAINPVSVTTPTRLNFQTSLFNFDLQHQVQMVARIDYDDSVNLYFVDNKNTFRVINTGFDQQGIYNDRYFWNGSFSSIISVFNQSDRPPIVDSMTQDLTGNLKYGNWFFFIRYTTYDFNSTSFLGVSSAVQIGVNPGSTYIENEGGPGSSNSNKAVTLNLINLDATYPVFEVAYIRYFDGSYETGLIDNLYPTDVSGNATIKITGNESVVSLDIGSLIKFKSVNDIPKTICQTENSAWIGNLKSKNLFNEELLTFARLIDISYDDTKQIEDWPFENKDSYPNGQYKDYENTFEYVGYFRGETYAFGIVFVFNDGKTSDALPLTGFDDYFATALNTNNNGIYRFPNNYASNSRTTVDITTGEGLLNILGVKFDATAAFASSIITDPNSWFNQNITGYYFVRGKRKNNLIYQGIAIQAYTSEGITYEGLNGAYAGRLSYAQSHLDNCKTVNDVQDPNKGSGGAIPLIGASVPWLIDCHDGGGPFYNNIGCWVANYGDYLDTGQTKVDNAYGVYSPDMFFINSFENNSYNVTSIAAAPLSFKSASFRYQYNPVNQYVYEPYGLLDSRQQNALSVAPQITECYNVPEWSISPKRGNTFVSLFEEGTATAVECWGWTRKDDGAGNYIEHRNRAFGTTRYIGIKGATHVDEFDIVNIYKNDPDPSTYQYANLYDISNTEYFPISRYKFIELSKRELISTCYEGDCFLQRTYIKQLGNPEAYAPTKMDNSVPNQVHWTFGIGIGFVTENNYNTAMRNADNNNTYYPHVGVGNPALFFADNIKRESTLLNTGYNVTLSPKAYQGFDEAIPFRKTKYPTRIAYSNRHDPNSLQDGYRQFDLVAYRDFDFRLGEITNIVDFKSNILNVQQFGISMHPISEKAMMNDGSAGMLTLGNGERLPLKPISVTDLYGSQHQWSIFKTPMGVYGIDANKRKVWRITAEGGVEVLSDTKFINTYIISVINSYGSTYSDIIDIIPDTPIYNKGIVTSYDQRYGDVIFTFLNQSGQSNTIAFNDKLNAFTTKYNFKSPFYISLNDNFYSIEPNTKNAFYVHDVATIGLIGNRAVWYGVPYKPYVEFIVNEYSDYTKIFDNLQLVSDALGFESIEYQTEQQLASQNPFIPITPPDMYAEPKYRENLWRMAVKRATGIIGNINNPYSIGSILRGKIMKVKLTFKEKEPNLLKSVLTFFKISKQ